MISIHALRAQASNIKRQNSREYDDIDFLEFYPQFKEVIPDVVLESYLELTNNVVNEQRFGGMWEMACGLFCAHMLTVWLQGYQEAGTPAASVVAVCSSAGVVTSESADGVSYSLDTSMLQDLQGWADFKLTRFGVQFAALANRVGHGGMYIW